MQRKHPLCPFCGTKAKPYKAARSFTCPDCRCTFRVLHPPASKQICRNCQKEFVAKRRNRFYCREVCKVQAFRQRKRLAENGNDFVLDAQAGVA